MHVLNYEIVIFELAQNATRPLPEGGVRRLYSFALGFPRLHPLHPHCPLVRARKLSHEIQHQGSLLLRAFFSDFRLSQI